SSGRTTRCIFKMSCSAATSATPSTCRAALPATSASSSSPPCRSRKVSESHRLPRSPRMPAERSIHHHERRCLTALLAIFLLTAGCMVGPDYTRPTIEQPASFKSQPLNASVQPVAAEWWRLYGDPELDRLVADANSSNQT